MKLVKAAVHVHSTWSYDGKWELNEVSKYFGKFGYRVVLLSEHDRNFSQDRLNAYRDNCRSASTHKCLLIPGIEYEDSTFDIPETINEPESYSITVNLPRLSYQQKSKGREVETLQGLLHARGQAQTVGDIDGDFGAKTDRGVRDFQRSNLIEVNGVVDQKTWEKLLS